MALKDIDIQLTGPKTDVKTLRQELDDMKQAHLMGTPNGKPTTFCSERIAQYTVFLASRYSCESETPRGQLFPSRWPKGCKTIHRQGNMSKTNKNKKKTKKEVWGVPTCTQKRTCVQHGAASIDS